MPFKEAFRDPADHSAWRFQVVDLICQSLDMERYGVKALYLIGSVKSQQAGPCSDIDLMAHCKDDPRLHECLAAFFEGWGLCLNLVNCQKTGYKTSGSLIDLHIITDEDIRQRSSFASMIGASENSARLLKKSSLK